jgi:hypothetical protein
MNEWGVDQINAIPAMDRKTMYLGLPALGIKKLYISK